MSGITNPLSLLASRVRLRGLRVLDIGCGHGGFAKELLAAGSYVTGIDPEASALELAATVAGGASFRVASAEALPFDQGSFDVVTMINSLHHVPISLMSVALREAARVLTSRGLLFVVEPLTTGTFFEALKPVEDETEVRLAAQAALDDEIGAGHFELLESIIYTRTEAFSDAQSVLDRIVAVDPRRAEEVGRHGETLLDHVHRVGRRTPDGRLMYDQPMKGDVLAARIPCEE